MCRLYLFILVNGVICGASDIDASDLDARLKKLESLAKEQVMDTKELKDRLTILERNVSDLITEDFDARFDQGKPPLMDPINNQVPPSEAATVTRHLSKRAPGEEVACHAYQSSTRRYNNHEILIFDTVTVNLRGGYTPYDGIFDVPIAGVYVFTWTVAAPTSGEKIATELVVHGVVKGVMTSDPDQTSSQSTGSGVHPATAFVVTQVGVGDNVFIRMRNVDGSSGTVLSDDNNVRTSFSAWLLF